MTQDTYKRIRFDAVEVASLSIEPTEQVPCRGYTRETRAASGEARYNHHDLQEVPWSEAEDGPRFGYEQKTLKFRFLL